MLTPKNFGSNCSAKHRGPIFSWFEPRQVLSVKHQKIGANTIGFDRLFQPFQAVRFVTISQNLEKLISKNSIFFHYFSSVFLLSVQHLIKLACHEIHYILHRVFSLSFVRIRSWCILAWRWATWFCQIDILTLIILFGQQDIIGEGNAPLCRVLTWLSFLFFTLFRFLILFVSRQIYTPSVSIVARYLIFSNKKAL